MRCVIDVEGNGLLDTLSTLWCAVAFDIDTGKYYEFILKDGDHAGFIEFLKGVSMFIGHNIFGYDLDAIEKITGYRYDGLCLDTLVYSRVLNPDRQIPEGCPTHIPDASGKKKLVGAHSLEAYGYQVAKKKPRIDRWDVWTPKMLHRCKEDVKINYDTLVYLTREAGLTQLVAV